MQDGDSVRVETEQTTAGLLSRVRELTELTHSLKLQNRILLEALEDVMDLVPPEVNHHVLEVVSLMSDKLREAGEEDDGSGS